MGLSNYQRGPFWAILTSARNRQPSTAPFASPLFPEPISKISSHIFSDASYAALASLAYLVYTTRLASFISQQQRFYLTQNCLWNESSSFLLDSWIWPETLNHCWKSYIWVTGACPNYSVEKLPWLLQFHQWWNLWKSMFRVRYKQPSFQWTRFFFFSQ